MWTRSLSVTFLVTLLVAPALLAQSPDGAPTSAAPSSAPSQASTAKSSSADEKLEFEGDTALWTVAIRPDKTADFEQVLAKLRQALTSSKDPMRRQQAAGWKVVRLTTPLPNGNVGYLHLINPVVPHTDYSVMRTLYDELPDERQALYELYRGAFAGNVALAVGNVALDLEAAASAAASPEAPASAPPVAPAATPQPFSSTPGVHSPPAVLR